MKSLRLLLLLALLCAGCSDPRLAATERVRRIGPERLRLDAALLYKETFSGHVSDAKFVIIRPKSWPRSFQELAPMRVGAYPDGVILALRSQHTVESGLYIVPKSMDLEPRDKAGARFEKLSDGIYWYWFGE